MERADADKEHMGLVSWDKAPQGKIVKSDVSIAKNYLKEDDTDREVLQGSGVATAEQAKEHAESEFEKYRILQDRMFESDFDKFAGLLPFEEK